MHLTKPEAIRSCQSILDNLATAVVLLDTGLRVCYLNNAAETLFGLSAKRITGHCFPELFPRAEVLAEALNRGLQQPQQFTKREMSLPLPGSHKPITVDCTITPLAHVNEDYALLVEIQQLDRMLRITREEALLAQQNAMKVLVRGLAHEVKNPLGGLRGAAQLLERELPNEELKEYTRIIIGEADRLQKLVDHMLGPNRRGEKKPLNIHEVLEHVRRLVLADSPPTLRIQRDYDPSIPDILGVKDQLIQAVLNIVQNARQALRDDGTIVLKTRVQRQFTIGQTRHRLVLRIDIIDDGPGIPKEMLSQIFYPMVTGRAEGTGLGLSIAQTLVGQHGGLVECKSEPGHTQFTLLLPLSEHHEGGNPQHEPH